MRESVLDFKCNPLMCWRERAPAYPSLAKVVAHCLVKQGTSVPSERVFSAARYLVSAHRACLDPGHVDMLLFLKTNYKLKEK